MTAQNDKDFEALLEYLRTSRGVDFTTYKRPTLMRRVEKRMQMVNVARFGDYLDFLEVHPEEFPQLFNIILINVTSFFRDEPAWDCLAKEIIPRIIKAKGAQDSIRVWSAGCASGEEPYSIAILLAETLGAGAFHERVKIYATDADEEALMQARQASYTEKDLQAVPAEFREKYFEAAGVRYAFRTDLRRSVIFGRHDLVQDAPISRLDLLVCRNTLMYFNAEAQARILARFHFALNESGYLFAGRAEMLLSHSDLFTPLEMKYRVFSKGKGNQHDRLLAMAPAPGGDGGNHIARQLRLREEAFDSAYLAQIVVDAGGKLALANERARTLLGLSPKDLGRPLQDLEASYRPVELRSLIDQSVSNRRRVTVENIERTLPDGKPQHLDVEVVPLNDGAGGTIGVSIVFNDRTQYRILQAELNRHQQELETAYEELQSSNEELETMNEEMQSTNAELQTINDELRQRTDELNQTNDFLESILSSLHDGVTVLDPDLNIKAWNSRMQDLWGLRAEEVKGQAFMNLDIGLPVEKLKGTLRSCLAGEKKCEEVVIDATTRRGKKISCGITCTPIIDSAKEVRAVILTMSEQEGKKNDTATL
jgi:two-component system CheB/CheR fusion protein